MKKRKGFTLVELLVVIAILAILAAVSIVGYLAFTNKAKESNDNTLITQLNTILQADETVDGKPKTMRDALGVLEENGFVVENLTPTSSNNEFLYNMNSNKFEIFATSRLNNLSDGSYWYIVEDLKALEDMSDKCSLYIKDNLELPEDIEIKYGFDSSSDSIKSITVANTDDVADNIILNTNAENIIINAEKDNVSHYGNVNNVEIEAVADNSFYEYGKVEKVEIKKGHIKFMTDSKVGEIYISSADAKVTISDDVEEYQNTKIIVASGITLPDGAVTKPSDSKDVITEVLVSTFADLKTKMTSKNDEVVKLNADIELTEKITFKQNASKKIDLNNNILKIKSEKIYIQKKSNVIIENGTIDYQDDAGAIKLKGANEMFQTDIVNLYLNNINFINVGNEQLTTGYIAIESEEQCWYNLFMNDCNIETSIPLIKIREKSNVVIDGGNYEMTTDNFVLIENYGNLTINDGSFKGASVTSGKEGIIYNAKNLEINGGSYISTYGATIYNISNATLNGGKYISKSCSECNTSIGSRQYIYSVYSGVNDEAFITVGNGVYIEGVHGGLSVTAGGASIDGGIIKTVKCENHDDTSHYALYFAGETGEAIIQVNGGEFTSYDKVAMYVGNSNDGGQKEDARVIVKGGTFNGGDSNKTAVKVDKDNGYLNVLGGKYSSDIKDIIGSLNTIKEGNYWIIA